MEIGAHPSWGIVVSSDHKVYFVDVLHDDGTLWKYDLEDCTLEALFKGHFHAHSLQIDKDDNLYVGLHIWIDGVIMGDGQNVLLKYDTRQKQLDTLKYAENYQELYGGNILFIPETKEFIYPYDKHLRKGNLAKKKSKVLSSHTFERISTLALDHENNIWVTDSYANGGTLYLMSKNRELVVYAQNLMPQNPENPVFAEKNHHLFYGISFTKDNVPLLTNSVSREVLKILPDGSGLRIYQSPIHYFPTGLFWIEDEIIIMEVGYESGIGHLGPRLIRLNNGRKEIVELFDY